MADTEYERYDINPRDPRSRDRQTDRRSLSSIVTSMAAIVSVVVVIVTCVWGYASVTFAAQSIPDLKTTVAVHGLAIEHLTTQSANYDERQKEILSKLDVLSGQIYNLNQSVQQQPSTANNQLRGFRR